MSPFSPLAGRVEVQAAARRESSGQAMACPNLSYWIWTHPYWMGFRGNCSMMVHGTSVALRGKGWRVVGPEKRRELTRGGIVGRANSIL